MSEKNDPTEVKILQSAKKEFLEKGFTAASLRTIAANAGLTTGAMYRHFKDKDALFCALVDEAILTAVNFVSAGGLEFHVTSPTSGVGEEHLHEEEKLMMDFVDYLYENFDAYTLLLTKASGSTHENFLDEIADINTENCEKIIKFMKEKFNINKPIDKMAIHLLATTMISAFAEVVYHKIPKDEATLFLSNIQEFFHFGFMHLLGLPCEH